MLRYFLIICLISLSEIGFAQNYIDKIYLVNESYLEGQVKEVTESFIKINYLDGDEVKEYIVKKENVVKIMYSNGYEEVFDTPTDINYSNTEIKETPKTEVKQESEISVAEELDKPQPSTKTKIPKEKESDDIQSQKELEKKPNKPNNSFNLSNWVTPGRPEVKFLLGGGYSQLSGSGIYTDNLSDGNGLGFSHGFNIDLTALVSTPLKNLSTFVGVNFTQWNSQEAFQLHTIKQKLQNVNIKWGLRYKFWRAFYLAGDIGSNGLTLFMDNLDESYIYRDKENERFFGTNVKLGIETSAVDIAVRMQNINSAAFGTLEEFESDNFSLRQFSLDMRFVIPWNY